MALPCAVVARRPIAGGGCPLGRREETMIEAVCNCGAVRIEVDAPQEVFDCPCSVCQKFGTLWSYYHPAKVRIIAEPGATDIYLRGAPRLEFHSCKVCGCQTHWAPVNPASPKMGVNARLMPPEVLAAARRGLGDAPD